MVLICTFMMISDVEHLFMCLLAIYISDLEKYLFKSSPHFLIRLLGGVFFVFCFVLVLGYVSSSSILNINLLTYNLQISSPSQ